MADIFEIAGRVHSTSQEGVTTVAGEILDESKGKKQSTINAETDAALNDRYTKSETYSKPQVNQMVAPQHGYVTVATYADLANISEHPAGCVYRVSNYDGTNSQVDATKYSEYSWDGTQYIHLATKSQIGEVFDISAYHATGGILATYADLSAALDSNNGGGVPQSLQKGGMSIKFVRTSDNNYVRYNFLLSSFTASQFANVDNWQKDDEPKNAVSLANTYFSTVPLEQGYLQSTTGLPIYSAKSVRTKYYIPTKSFINVKTGYVISNIYRFTPNEEGGFDFVSYTGYQNTTSLAVTESGFVYRFVFAKSDNTDILPTDDIIDVFFSSDIESIKNIVNDYQIKKANVSDGRYWDLSGSVVSLSPTQTSSVDYFRCCDEIPVKAGDVFILTSRGGANARAYALTDKNRTILSKADSSAYCLEQTITAPQDGFLFVNCIYTLYNMFSLKKQYSVESIEKDENILLNNIDFNLKSGAYWNTSGTSVTGVPIANANYAYSNEIPVKKGDVFLLTTQGASNARAYALTDTNKNIVEVANANAYLYEKEINVTEDGYLYVNCNTGFYSKFRLVKKHIIGEHDAMLNGGIMSFPELLTTYEDSALDQYGDILTNKTGYEVKEYSTKPNHIYHVITRMASTGIVWGRCFVYKLKNVDTKVGYVPLAFQGYGASCDVTFSCDGSFTKIRVFGLTGVQTVVEITPAVDKQVENDDNGMPLLKSYPDGRIPMLRSASCFAMIRKWGFIGASYESGGFEYKVDGVTQYMQDYDVSYPQILAKMNGCDAWNFSASGESAKQWCTRTVAPSSGITWDVYDREWNNGNSRVATELKQAYVVELGSNDMSQGQAVGNLSTDVDLTDYRNNADTYAGWICGVIQRVLSVNPKAFFFVCTVRRYYNGNASTNTGKRFQASDIVRQLPDFFKDGGITDRIYVLDIEKYGIDWAAPNNIAYYNGTHPTAFGYYYLACWFNTYIDYIIRSNMDAFKDVQFVGTDKQYNEWNWTHSV